MKSPSNGQARRRFQYKPRSAKVVEQRASQQGTMFDAIIKSQYKTFKPKKGENSVRIMPPTWEDADHYAMDVIVHRNVGPDNQSYLCLKMQGKPCAICEERLDLVKHRESDAAKAIRPVDSRVAWVIDRDKEKEGPMVWVFGWTMDKNIALLCRDRRTGEVLFIDDPEEGYDFSFSKDGEGIHTQYRGEQVDRRASPLHDRDKQAEEWLDYIMENPLTDVLNFYSYEHLMEVMHGKPVDPDEEDEVDERPARRRSVRDDDEDEDEVPPPKRTRREPEPEDEVEEDEPKDEDTEEGEVEDEDEPASEPPPRQRLREPEPEDEAPPPRRRQVADPSEQAREGLRKLRPPGQRPSQRG